jgi:peptidoglycan hydrolase-like protein with peptidoglycan-binding domain/3D (Asp-Asp-Asp) domain-containing protein
LQSQILASAYVWCKMQGFFSIQKIVKKQIQKIIGLAVLTIQLLAISPVALAGNIASGPGEPRKFLITAYYSPLPDQSFYVRGNYEADVRLNGRGTNGADGTQVYIGMLAAPKSYPFGTRIKFPGLGVGEVHDRGGAILAGRDYDRIDIWMGRGEEGLSRALNWGARIVEGEIYWQADQIEPGLDYGWVNSELSDAMFKKYKIQKLQNPAVFTKPITKESNAMDIKELQEALTTFGYYNGPINGIYGPETTEAVLAFQLAEGVIISESSAGAGYFGPKTRVTLKERLENFNADVTKERNRLEENRTMLASGLGKNAEGDDVTALQRMLWELGYYNGELTGDYDPATVDAVFEFQKAQGILNSERDKGAGYYGKKTHAALTAAVDQKIEKVGKYPMQMQVWVPAERELPKIASLQAPEGMTERQALSFSPDLVNKKVVQPVSSGQLLTADLDIDEKSENVVLLQNILIKNGYLAKGLVTGYYGNQTVTAVTKFQMEKGIIKSETDSGAGRVGPKTRAALNSL